MPLRNRPILLLSQVVLFTLLVLCGNVPSGQAQSNGLEPGDPMAPLQVTQWLQGDPVKGWEPGKIYVIDLFGR